MLAPSLEANTCEKLGNKQQIMLAFYSSSCSSVIKAQSTFHDKNVGQTSGASKSYDLLYIGSTRRHLRDVPLLNFFIVLEFFMGK